MLLSDFKTQVFEDRPQVKDEYQHLVATDIQKLNEFFRKKYAETNPGHEESDCYIELVQAAKGFVVVFWGEPPHWDDAAPCRTLTEVTNEFVDQYRIWLTQQIEENSFFEDLSPKEQQKVNALCDEARKEMVALLRQ